MAPEQTDPAFVQFTDARYGIRAIAKILLNYQREGFVTVRQMINRWAPPVENDTSAYVTDVAADMGVDPDAPVTFPDQLVPMVEAIIRHENGSQPYPPEEIAEGVALAH